MRQIDPQYWRFTGVSYGLMFGFTGGFHIRRPKARTVLFPGLQRNFYVLRDKKPQTPRHKNEPGKIYKICSPLSANQQRVQSKYNYWVIVLSKSMRVYCSPARALQEACLTDIKEEHKQFLC